MKRLDPAEERRRLDALTAARGSFAIAARQLGMPRNTLNCWYQGHLGRGGAPIVVPEPVEPAPEPPPAERHDARWWRRRAQELQAETERLHRLVEELGAIRQVPVSVPDWVLPSPGARRGSVLIVHTSDWHMGEVIEPGQLHGVNAFSPEICRARLMRLAGAAVEMGRRWQSDTEPRGVILTLAGDLVSGDIHEELARTNALTSVEQVAAAAELANGLISVLLEAFGRVHVVAVPGNHGRTTRKPTAKLYGALSYDTMVAGMAAERWRAEPRVTWQADGSTDQMLPVFGWRLLVTHGDKIGTGGGQGFAGPVLPILRGSHKVRAQMSDLGVQPSLILMGHYHTSAAVPGVLANGSVPGWSEYGRDIRGGVEPPKQWLALLTERWGLRERCDVQLEEPVAPGKPRLRLPADMVPA